MPTTGGGSPTLTASPPAHGPPEPIRQQPPYGAQEDETMGTMIDGVSDGFLSSMLSLKISEVRLDKSLTSEERDEWTEALLKEKKALDRRRARRTR